jgi:hypothetical protein
MPVQWTDRWLLRTRLAPRRTRSRRDTGRARATRQPADNPPGLGRPPRGEYSKGIWRPRSPMLVRGATDAIRPRPRLFRSGRDSGAVVRPLNARHPVGAWRSARFAWLQQSVDVAGALRRVNAGAWEAIRCRVSLPSRERAPPPRRKLPTTPSAATAPRKPTLASGLRDAPCTHEEPQFRRLVKTERREPGTHLHHRCCLHRRYSLGSGSVSEKATRQDAPARAPEACEAGAAAEGARCADRACLRRRRDVDRLSRALWEHPGEHPAR